MIETVLVAIVCLPSLVSFEPFMSTGEHYEEASNHRLGETHGRM